LTKNSFAIEREQEREGGGKKSTKSNRKIQGEEKTAKL